MLPIAAIRGFCPSAGRPDTVQEHWNFFEGPPILVDQMLYNVRTNDHSTCPYDVFHDRYPGVRLITDERCVLMWAEQAALFERWSPHFNPTRPCLTVKLRVLPVWSIPAPG